MWIKNSVEYDQNYVATYNHVYTNQEKNSKLIIEYLVLNDKYKFNSINLYYSKNISIHIIKGFRDFFDAFYYVNQLTFAPWWDTSNDSVRSWTVSDLNNLLKKLEFPLTFEHIKKCKFQ